MACCGEYEGARSDSDAGGSWEDGAAVVAGDVTVLVFVVAPDRMVVPLMPLWDKESSSFLSRRTSRTRKVDVGFATVAHVHGRRTVDSEDAVDGCWGWGSMIFGATGGAAEDACRML